MTGPCAGLLPLSARQKAHEAGLPYVTDAVGDPDAPRAGLGVVEDQAEGAPVS